MFGGFLRRRLPQSRPAMEFVSSAAAFTLQLLAQLTTGRKEGKGGAGERVWNIL